MNHHVCCSSSSSSFFFTVFSLMSHLPVDTFFNQTSLRPSFLSMFALVSHKIVFSKKKRKNIIKGHTFQIKESE